MGKKSDQIPSELKFPVAENQLHPAIVGVCANLVVFPWVSSPTRIYMVGNMIPKAVVTSGASERKMITGFEYQYAEAARRIEASSNMVVEEIFYVKSLVNGPGHEELTDKWNSIFVLFKNDEKNKYDILELPRYNTQNTYVGFEYVYDKDVMRKLTKGAYFPKGTVFAKSPRISKSGEWMFGMDLKVAPASFPGTEEDGIWITDVCAVEKLRCMFKHERKYAYNEDEMIPLMLYGNGTRPFPESGEQIRPDGLVMGFRRRISEHALVSLTKKSLTEPDWTHDILFKAPTNSVVMSVEVLSDRMKNRANNRSTDYIDQPHNALLDRYEKKQNEMWNEVTLWYNRKVGENRGNNIAITDALTNFINNAYGNYTRHHSTGKINPLSRSIKRSKLKDWNITITLREMVPGRTKFKMSGMNGDKGVIVRVIPQHEAPRYDDGTVADVIVNNTPAFRRQIYSMLMEQSINFININVHKEVVAARKAGDYDTAYAKLMLFYETGFPEFAEIVKKSLVNPEDIRELVDHVAKTQISVQVRSDTKLYGVAIINALRKVYSYEPQHITFTNSLGESVRSVNPVLITNQHFMLLDKFGTDMSAQSLPVANPFGMPAKLNDTTKYASFIRDVWNRNSGETETRLRVSQVGPKEVQKQLAMAYAPELRTRMTQRIIRAHDPFNINQVIKPDEYGFNRAVKMSASMLSDSGFTLRRQQPSDLTEDTYVPSIADIPMPNMVVPTSPLPGPKPAVVKVAEPEAPDTLIKRERLDEPATLGVGLHPAWTADYQVDGYKANLKEIAE